MGIEQPDGNEGGVVSLDILRADTLRRMQSELAQEQADWVFLDWQDRAALVAILFGNKVMSAGGEASVEVTDERIEVMGRYPDERIEIFLLTRDLGAEGGPTGVGLQHGSSDGRYVDEVADLIAFVETKASSRFDKELRALLEESFPE